jgi:hypothetical protein
MDAFDSTFLAFLFVPNAKCETDRAKDRIDYLTEACNVPVSESSYRVRHCRNC